MRRIAMANFILAIDLSYVFDVNFYIRTNIRIKI